MDLFHLFSNPALNVIVVSLIIFTARIIDVSLGTLRVIFISKDNKKVAALIGFIEVLIWLIVVQKVISSIDHWFYFIAYAGGFATGTYVGLLIEEHFTKDKVIIRIIAKSNNGELIKKFRAIKCSATVLEGKKENWNKKGLSKVKVYYLVANKKHIPTIIQSLKEVDKNAHYTIEKVTEAVEDTFEWNQTKNSIFSKIHPFKKFK